MAIDHMANQDFERAVSRGFWRKILARLSRGSNDLLPFDEVRERLPIRGQHYLGLQQVHIDKIVGSMGRYRDFDRAFLPLQRRTKDRWVSIDKAHYEQVNLPPLELFKMGEIYFVKDGNHRVSVARERGQVFLDAYVTEIDIPISLTPETRVNDLELKKEYGEFLLKTHLIEIRPDAHVETRLPGLYAVLLDHIDVHRWYLGEQRKTDVPYSEAVASWYDQVYMPLVQMVRDQDLLHAFPGSSEADLYLWILEYQGYLRQAYKEASGVEDTARAEAGRQLIDNHPHPAVRKLINTLAKTDWISDLVLEQERAAFLEQTRIGDIRPQAQIMPTMPGQFDKIREHIAVHRWYLGEQRKADIPYGEAVASWYDQVYFPLIEIIREQGILREFPGRTETDLYLWIIEHQWYLREAFGDEVPFEQAAERFAEDYSQRPVKKTVNRVLKKALGGKK